MKNFGKLALLGAALAVSATSAFATPITNNGSIVSPGATTLAAATSGTFVGTASGTLNPATFLASWTESVYSGASGNTLGGLTFVFSFSNTVDPLLTKDDPIGTSVDSYFNGFLVDADVAGPGTAPSNVFETVGGSVNWVFGAGVAPGTSSDTMVLYTNALYTQPGTFGLHDGSDMSEPDIAPSLSPEPNSLMLMGTGLVGAAGMLFRRRRQTV